MIWGGQAVDLSINCPRVIDSANAILARYDSGISNRKYMGVGVLENAKH